MAGQLMLINPRRKHRRKRKMSALQRQYFGRRGKRRSPARTIVVANPRRKRRHHRHHHARRRSSRRSFVTVVRNPRRRHRRSRGMVRMRRNPITRDSFGDIGNILMGGAIGAVGGIGVNMAFSKLPLPPSMGPGTTLYPILKIGAAVLLGIGVGAVTDKKTGTAAGVGAVSERSIDRAPHDHARLGGRCSLG